MNDKSARSCSGNLVAAGNDRVPLLHPQKFCEKVSIVSSFPHKRSLASTAHLQKHDNIHEELPPKRLRPPIFPNVQGMHSVKQPCHLPCWYSPRIQSRSPPDARYTATAPLLNQGSFSLPLTQPNSCGHSPFFMRKSSWMVRLCQELPAYFARVKVFHLKLSDSIADLAAKKVDCMVHGDRMRIISHIGQVQWRWFFSSSLLLRLLGKFPPNSKPPFQVSSSLHSRLWGDQRDDSLQSSPRQ